ncbi:MAG TPA: NADH-quinone oxidoreductase subunit NuoG [Methylibium sp.]|uniref:NADH-quinone oxidoreductase subunit NuoG n=1 Tax=Methylibium sp. TaxID=2067992 RepID=UPI002DBCAA84|nr:NADH-quinone oxidoreductase subunit NuoG [Methylibium sp.]HEU4459678.1 NADH-quinone oxidoreductase subunit NuoG [Methylibium sp.]
MVEIELDGKKVSVPEGSMVMHAADAAGTYIPHFCYHKKLSIAANCRMCLVDVEKAPKPMPACATPVTQGMIVRTKSEKAVKAQQSVMEFLLINHPLDCPICDQGGECQLQDLAVGYGKSASRYDEEKRVVAHKNVGPLISMEEMTRCIHCTRCVRFGQEVAGVMELGMIHRGEHSEITTVAGDTVDSELSGNMIDLCPVGALTSKPFRYSARTWELSRRKSVSPHDSTGANLIVQVKGGRVMRVLPLENEAVNECWLADRDRFSYEALNSDDRLTRPMLKQNGQWVPVEWATAMEYVANGLLQIRSVHGAASIGALASPISTVEELHLLGELMRGFGSGNVDHRLRHTRFDASTKARWLGTSIASLSTLDSALVVGSFLRKDHPLFAQRLRQAAKRGAQISMLHALDDAALIPTHARITAAPSGWVDALARIASAVAAAAGVAAPLKVAADEALDARAAAIAKSLGAGSAKAVLLGNAAAWHPQADALLALARFIAQHTGASCGYFGEAGNSVGAQLAGAQPSGGDAKDSGLDAGQMLAKPLKAYLLLNTEPALDAADARRAATALVGAEMVVSMSPFRSANAEFADVLLPIAPFTETGGSFVNAEGRLQSFHGVVKPLGETRPGWKVLRVLGTMLGLDATEVFRAETVEQVRACALGDPASIDARLDNAIDMPAALTRVIEGPPPSAVERIADWPIYASDAIVRRSPPLQATADAAPARVGLPTALWRSLGLAPNGWVQVKRGSTSVRLQADHDPSLAPNAVRIPAGQAATAALGSSFGELTVERLANVASAPATETVR